MSRNNTLLNNPKAFDLNIPAKNGLKRGYTTGTCATAATRAALTLLLANKKNLSVPVTLPTGNDYSSLDWHHQQFISIPIDDVAHLDRNTVRALVIKDAGDDPDRTDGAAIFADVKKNNLKQILFFAGKGVGTITKSGINLPIGEPAINTVPRQMMQQAVIEVLNETGLPITDLGYDITIGCLDGETIAKKTFNPRLGIVGGISILGTSGIVEPMSLASWIAAIEVYVKVALADEASEIAFLPGKIARGFIKDHLQLPAHRAVEIANFLGDALNFTQTVLNQQQRRLPKLWITGHPGKLAKILDGTWNTHSSNSNMAMSNIANVGIQIGLSEKITNKMKRANTVESIIQQVKHHTFSKTLWVTIEHEIAKLVNLRVPNVDQVEVRLFDLHGNLIGIEA